MEDHEQGLSPAFLSARVEPWDPWTGTNSGPGGTGRSVHISGYEQWTFSADGLLQESQGHYDEAEYQRQVSGDGKES